MKRIVGDVGNLRVAAKKEQERPRNQSRNEDHKFSKRMYKQSKQLAKLGKSQWDLGNSQKYLKVTELKLKNDLEHIDIK